MSPPLDAKGLPAEDQPGRAAACAIVQSLADAVILVDESRRIVLVNAQAESQFGYSSEELLGADLEILLPQAARERHRAHCDAYVADPRVRPMGTGRDLHARARDGREFPVEISLSPLETDAGRFTCASIRDTTERELERRRLRAAEDRFRGAFESAAIGMALVAPDGRWQQVNRSLCELIGYSEEELLSGGTFQAVTHPDDIDADLSHVRRMLAGEIETYQMDKRYIHKRGHTLWIRLNVSLVRDAEGEPVHFVSQLQDITQQKRTEELAEQLKELLAETLDVGVRGFLGEDAPLPEVLSAVRAAAAGGARLDDHAPPARQADPFLETPPLTPREVQILAMIADGMTNDKVAAELAISAETVQSHVRNAMGKLRAETRTQAVATALRHSLLA